MQALQIKICGITQSAQGVAIAQMGASMLGFICVERSPRFVTPKQIEEILSALSENGFAMPAVKTVGVFADAPIEHIQSVLAIAPLTVVQLHGTEPPEFCFALRAALPHLQIIKALRVRSAETLAQAEAYADAIDGLLLDAYQPDKLGGTGKTLDWQMLRSFRPSCPWLLAGGLNPDNVLTAIKLAQPDGVDLSSGVEHTPGNKNLDKVAQLFDALNSMTANHPSESIV